MLDTSETVTVGLIERPFGVKGEVKVRSLSDVPGRLETMTAVTLVAKNGTSLDTNVTSVRRAGQGFLVKFAGLTSPEEAGCWRGSLIQVARGVVPTLPAGQYYECDLIGLEVQTEQGQPIGVLAEVMEVPAGHVFVVRQGGKETLIPAVKAWVINVDLDNRRMTVHAMDGMDG